MRTPTRNTGLQLKLDQWLGQQPNRRIAIWQNSSGKPLIWKLDRRAYTPSGLAMHIIHEATGNKRHSVRGTEWWIDSRGKTLVDIASEEDTN